MNSALKPLTASTQNPAATNQLSKAMHPQGATPATYGQPSHIPQSLVTMHPNTNAAHNHPSSQQHHYSLNVPNASGHYLSQNMNQIPASNHPVANPTASAAGQIYNPPKNVSYIGGYQPNLGHPPNQNALPPVSQTLPATTPPQQNLNSSSPPPESISERPQSNGTPEAKTPPKIEAPPLPVPPVKEKTPQPVHAQISQVSPVPEKLIEKPKPAQVQEIKTPEPAKTPDTPESNAPTPPLSNSESNSSSPVTPAEVISTTTTVQPEKVDIVEEEKENTDKNIPESSTENIPQIQQILSSENSNASSENFREPKEAEVSEKEEKTESEPVVEDKEIPAPTVTAVKPKEQSPPKKELSPPKPAPIPKTPSRKPKTPKPEEAPKTPKEPKTPAQKSPSTGKVKRQRTRTQPYQSPLPELEIISKISSSTPRHRSNDEKLIVFYKNEFLAVRNAEGGFYLCQAVQNIYKTSSKIKIRWLSQEKSDKSGEIYTPDFYDLTDFDCILTNLSLGRVDKGKYRLPPAEKERTESILNRSLAVEKGEVTSPSLTEEHPDGLDLSLYKDEEQLKKRRGTKRKAGRKPSKSPAKKVTPTKKSPEAPKVRKVTPKPPPKKVAKKPLPAPAVKKPAPPPPEPKKVVTSSSRTGRGKRKVETKSSPVVDQKKAKVLAKIGRKPMPLTKPQSTAKTTKVAPAAPSTKATTSSKKTTTKTASTPVAAAAAAKPPPTRSAKRSTRKHK